MMSRWRRFRRALVMTIAGGLILYMGLLVYGRFQLHRARTSFLKTYGTLDLASFERLNLPRRENAAEWLRAGASAILLDRETENRLRTLAWRPSADWKDSDRDTLRAVLADNRCALELLHRAASAPQSSYEIHYSQGVRAAFPDMRALGVAGAVLALKARLDIERHDLGSAVVALKTLARLSASLEDEPHLICQISGITCERMRLTVLSEVLATPMATAGQTALLQAMREALSGNDLAAQARKAISTEALAMSSVFAGHVRREWLPEDVRLLALILAPLSDLLRAEVLDQATAQGSVLLSPGSAGTTASERPRGLARYLPHVRIAYIVTGSWDTFGETARETLASRQLVKVALELRALGVVGAYPATLPRELQRPDPFTGQPLAYTLRPDGSAVLALQLPANSWRRTGPVHEITLPPPVSGR